MITITMSVPDCVQGTTFGFTYLPWLASTAPASAARGGASRVWGVRWSARPEAGWCEPMQTVQADGERGERRVVERDVVAEIDAEPGRGALAQAQALVAPVGLHRVHEEEHHLREGERDHDEVHAARAQRNRADRERRQGGSRDCRRPADPRARDAFR